jgi:hypothetical protein
VIKVKRPSIHSPIRRFIEEPLDQIIHLDPWILKNRSSMLNYKGPGLVIKVKRPSIHSPLPLVKVLYIA